ncbi:MAG: hypothetical protein ACRD2Y_05070 [Terriglobales bacterium]
MTTTPNSPGVSHPPFTWLGWNWLHLAALAGFLAIYFLVERDPSFAPVSALALLVCVLARLDDEKRRVAVVPLSLAALMLAGRVGVYAASTPTRWPGEVEQPGVGWLPLFFAACIFLTPELTNYTGRFMMSMSVLLLVSGLLPGEGFEFIFITCQYFLFLAVGVGLSIDFTRYLAAAGNAQGRTT